MLNVAQGHLFGTVFEAILYGIYFTLFIICLFVFNDGKRVNKVILYTMCVMFLLSTAHLAGTIRSLQEGFFGSLEPTLYFNIKALPLNLANKAMYFTNMVIGDSLLIYRLYVIYQGNLLVIALPSLCLAGTTVAVTMLDWEFSRLKPGVNAFAHSVNITAPAAFGLPLATNIIITGLIIFRVKQAERLCRDSIDKASTPVYRMIILGTVESCVIYPITLIFTLALYCTHNNGQDILTGSMTQIVSLVPTLMWMQVQFGVSRYEAAMRTSSTDQTTTRDIEFAPSTAVFIMSKDEKDNDNLSL